MRHSWKPTAHLKALQTRATILAKIRAFFKDRQVLEVETPLLSHSTVTDPHLHSFSTHYYTSSTSMNTLYLQTSPEFAMKRLLAVGSGPIYQITHAFRNNGEQGRWHNPEFTMLEWYRPDWTLSNLMDEVNDLLQLTLNCPIAERISYQALFEKFLGINPHQVTLQQIQSQLKNHSIELHSIDTIKNVSEGLQLLLDHIITHHHYTIDHPVFIYDFPVSQAALAKIRQDHIPVAERVEVYFKNLELANGFFELSDPLEQSQRFQEDLKIRSHYHLPKVPIDDRLLAALQHGLPDCSGIALGIDRLLALAMQAQSLAEVTAFSIDNA